MYLVYIAGPYSSAPKENTRKALHFGAQLDAAFERANVEATCFVPHVFHFWELVSGERPYSCWIEKCLALVDRVDVLVVLPGESEGARLEAERFGGGPVDRFELHICGIDVDELEFDDFDDFARDVRAYIEADGDGPLVTAFDN